MSYTMTRGRCCRMKRSKSTFPSRTSGVSAVTTTNPDCSIAMRSRSTMSLVLLMTATVVGSFTIRAYHPSPPPVSAVAEHSTVELRHQERFCFSGAHTSLYHQSLGMHAKRILIVEDDADLRRLFRMALSVAGYDVEEAGDGVEALQLVD